MTRLVRMEVRRLTSRRLFRLLLALAVGGIMASGVVNLFGSNRDLDAASEEARRVVAECHRFSEGFEGRDEASPCPSVEQVASELDPRFSYAQDMPDTVRAIGVFLALLGFVVGASSVGADWGAGTVATLLTWEPRRGRVLGAKLVAVAATTFIAAVVLLALLSVVHVPAAVFRGDASGMTGALWWTIAGTWLRAGLLVAMTATVGLGLASVFRSTAGAVGVGFAYFTFGDTILANIRGQRFLPWALQRNVPWLLGFPPSGDENGGTVLIPSGSPVRPTVVIASYAAVVVAMGYASFRMRDVT